VVVIAAVTLVDRSGRGPRGPVGIDVDAGSGTPSPPPPSVPSGNAPRSTVDFPERARSDALEFLVIRVTHGSIRQVRPCRVATYDGDGAYVVGCPQIRADLDKELMLVSVYLRNHSDEAVRFEMDRFVATSPTSSFDPVDVRSDFDYAPFLFPREGLIPPGARKTGWLTFDGRADAKLVSISYIHGDDEILTVKFKGSRKVELWP
jgi:hypothetical protein